MTMFGWQSFDGNTRMAIFGRWAKFEAVRAPPDSPGRRGQGALWIIWKMFKMQTY